MANAEEIGVFETFPALDRMKKVRNLARAGREAVEKGRMFKWSEEAGRHNPPI